MKNEKGFTLLEQMLTLTVLLAIIWIIPLLMSAALQESRSDFQQEEASLFFHLFSKEIREATNVAHSKGSIEVVKRDGTVVKYEMYGSSIRRRVNNTGHEIVLQEVRGFVIEISGSKVMIEVELNNGTKEKQVCFQMS
ncbi:competence type IV pilus minor pilin ComGF [Pseudalkalibacillus hwajinpoensis]|uniref:competence type IV pilus minor pilin ComGF n=1 Tax=Guptibacillus hwajinpoensis TaxID=208199 RepID=UPI001CFD60B0|nr:competence type IV pilus minor pilin ComGF [Pseudalkalibacillus hwajinpoensis]